MFIYDHDTNSMFMTLTFYQWKKVESLTQNYRNLIENPKPKLWEITRFILLNSASCDTSILTNEISATSTSGIYKKAISLPLSSSSESKFNS